MALERGKLSNVVQVAAASTVGIATVVSSKKVYVKSIICHVPGTVAGKGQVYFCPVGVTSGPTNKIFDEEEKKTTEFLIKRLKESKRFVRI